MTPVAVGSKKSRADGRAAAAETEAPVPAPPEGDSLQHVAFLYENESQYLSGISAFVRAAVRRDDPVLVAVPGFRAGQLRDELGRDARRVAFADMAEMGLNPGRIIPALHAFTDRQPGGRASVVGEVSWPGRSEAESREVARHEALVNRALGGVPLTAVCAYDLLRLPAGVLATAEQTHPILARPGHWSASPAFLGADEVPPGCREPLPRPPEEAETCRYHRDLRPVRLLIERWADLTGLPADRAADVVLAVSELAANTLRHTQGGGTLRVWRAAGELVCDISDEGWIADPLAGRRRPAPDEPGGHGLWLVHQVCDLVETRTGPAGTTIRLHMSLPG